MAVLCLNNSPITIPYRLLPSSVPHMFANYFFVTQHAFYYASLTCRCFSLSDVDVVTHSC